MLKKSHSTCRAVCIIYNWQLMKWLFTQLKLWTSSTGAKLSQSFLRERDSMETKDRQLIFFCKNEEAAVIYQRNDTLRSSCQNKGPGVTCAQQGWGFRKMHVDNLLYFYYSVAPLLGLCFGMHKAAKVLRRCRKDNLLQKQILMEDIWGCMENIKY